MRALILRLGRGELPWALVDQGVVSGANFLTGILLVRALGLVEFGVYTLAWLGVQLAQALVTSLIVRPMMSLGPKGTGAEAERYREGVVALAAVASLLLAAALGLAALGADAAGLAPGGARLAPPLAMAALAALIQDFERRRCFTFGAPRRALLLDAARGGSQVLLAFWLLLGTAAPDAALTLWAMAAAHGLAVLVGMLAPGRPAILWAELLPVGRRHWQIGRWLIGTTLLEWLQGQFLTLVAGSVLGAATVGALRATQHVIGITHLLFEGLQNVVPVGASRALATAGPAALRGYTARAILGIGLATSAIVVVILAAPEAWLGLVYGDRLTGWGWLLYWQGAIYLAMIPGLPLAAGLIALERTRPLFLAQLLGAIAAVGLGWPAARALGVEGLMILMLAVLIARQLLLGASFLRESAPVAARGA